MDDLFMVQLLCMHVITLKLIEIIHTNLPKHEPVSLSPLPQSFRSSWIISIEDKIDQAREYEPSLNLSIYHVPKPLRGVDETSYTPNFVSLGPYHRGLPHLQDMNHHKWRALRHALARKGHNIRLYLEAVRSLEHRARACYQAPLSISSEDFVESLVLDSIFLLELFCGFWYGFEKLGYAPNDSVFGRLSTMSYVLNDMLKLENQLPLFVLDRILALQLGYKPPRLDLVASFALNFLYDCRPCYETGLSNILFDPLSMVGSSNALHCLDLFRRRVLLGDPKSTSKRHKKRQQVNINSVSKLRDTGIEFRCRKTDRFWDIRFKDGVLHIPSLFIQDRTKSVFLNLLAFEQCHLKSNNHITSYIMLMDNLINSEVDVGYLQSKGIIKSCLGTDKEVADLFNMLFQEVVFDVNDYYFSELAEQVNRHCGRRWNAWRANLHQKYLNNPWTIISLVAAFVLLFLTFGQTFYTMYGYYKPF